MPSISDMPEDESLLLDLVRALSAQMVLVGHALSFFDIYPAAKDPYPLYMQNVGVLCFFLLSGYVISQSTTAKSASPAYGFASYFADRFVRIFSAWIPALIVVLIVDSMANSLMARPVQYVESATWWFANLVMLQDYPLGSLAAQVLNTAAIPAFPQSFGSARPFWTIAVEWWLYLFYGWVFFWRRSRWPQAALAAVLVLLLVVPLFNLVGGRGNGLTLVWFMGVAVLMLKKHEGFRAITAGDARIIVLMLGLCAAMRLQVCRNQVYDPVFAALLAAMLLFGIVGLRDTRVFSRPMIKRMIRGAAAYSFSLYLLHYTVLDVITSAKLTIPPMALLVGSVVLINLIAYAFAWCTEFRHRGIRAWVRTRLGV